MSKLVDGLIPKHTMCPFVKECNQDGKDECPTIHKGLEHKVDFSCAIARGFNMMKKYR